MSDGQKFNGYTRGVGGGPVRGPSGPDPIEEGPVGGHPGNCDSTRKDFRGPNPFVLNLQLTTLEKIQAAVMTVTFVPIRLVLMGICLVFAWFFAHLSLIGRSKEDEMTPMIGWRRFIRPLAVFFSRALFFCGGFHWVTVKGKRATSAEAPILVTAPHTSYMDALPVTLMGLTTVVAKEGYVPFFSTLTKFTQPIFVSREDQNSRQNTVKEIQRRAETRGEWPQIVIFAEGTCTNRTCLIKFKPGAFIPGIPVQPVCLKYSNKLDTATWTWKGPSALKILWLGLCQFQSKLEIEYLPVYVPSEEEKKDVQLFGRNVRAQMARALGVPTSENSFEDGRSMINAEQLNLPNAEDLVHINRIVRELGISADVLKERLPSLCTVAQSSTSSVTLDEFAAHLKSRPSSPHLKELFLFYQITGEEAVDLRKCVMNLYLLTLPRLLDDFLKFCFCVYDRKHKGFLTVAELNDLLMALELPRSAVDFLMTSGDGPALQISFEFFKATAETLPEYDNLFKNLHPKDKKRRDLSPLDAEKTKSE